MEQLTVLWLDLGIRSSETAALIAVLASSFQSGEGRYTELYTFFSLSTHFLSGFFFLHICSFLIYSLAWVAGHSTA